MPSLRCRRGFRRACELAPARQGLPMQAAAVRPFPRSRRTLGPRSLCVARALVPPGNSHPVGHARVFLSAKVAGRFSESAEIRGRSPQVSVRVWCLAFAFCAANEDRRWLCISTSYMRQDPSAQEGGRARSHCHPEPCHAKRTECSACPRASVRESLKERRVTAVWSGKRERRL